VYRVKVIDVAQVFVGLHARCVLLISVRALDSLDDRELQAVAAHEVGHEFLWSTYYESRAERDQLRLKAIELMCDGIGALILDSIGVDPRRLPAALAKLLRLEKERAGAGVDESHHPPGGEREAFVRAVHARLRKGGY
jgi:hypothetical protein